MTTNRILERHRKNVPGTAVMQSRPLEWNEMAYSPVYPDSLYNRKFRAYVEDGILVAIVSQDLAGKNGKPIWHVSVSHRASLSGPDGGELHVRYPNWDELKDAKYNLVPVDVPMFLIFPRRSEPYTNEHPTTLHLWEEA